MVMIPNAPRMGDMPKGQPIPEGTYHLRCDKAEYKISQKNRIPMAVCELTVFGPADAEEYHGRKIFENFMLSGEGMFRTRQFLEAAGEGADFILSDTDQLKGMEVAAVVQIEEGKKDPETGVEYDPRNRVKAYKAIA